jgi:2-methylcitrate dehydratase PrpD
MMGLTQEIGGFLADMSFERVPAAAVPIVCTGFTDCVGVALEGLAQPVVAIVAKWAGFHGPMADIAAFATDGIAAPDLALILGTAAHALDYDDTGFTGHPSAVLVPAVLAEATEVGADGRAMVAAYLAGYEIWGELTERESGTLHEKGWHPSAMYGTIAAAGASAVLRGLDRETATRAVAIAASLASGVIANFGTMTKPFHLGRTAQSGLAATRLAEGGLTAAADAIEHDLGFLRAISPERQVDTKRPAMFGRRWRILEQGLNVKLYPLCFGAHRVIDAMLGLRAANSFDPEDIAAVDAHVSASSAGILRNSRPKTALEAKFSAEFAVAAAAIAGRCGGTELTDAFVLRPDVQALIAKVAVHPVTERDPADPSRSPHDWIEVTLADGRRLVSEKIADPSGHFRRGVERDVLWRKFAACAAAMVDDRRAAGLFAALQNLPSLKGVGDLRPSLASAAE